MRLAFVVIATCAATACTPFDPPSGVYGCAVTKSACPGGYYCAEDSRCWREGSGPPLTVLAGQIGGRGFADGEGAAMRFSLGYSRQLAVDDAGIVYFADNQNEALRRLDPALKTLVTLAPTSAVMPNPSLSSPTGVAVGPGDLLYIVESYGRQVRRMKLRTGEIDVIAGAQGMSRDGPLGVGAFTNPSSAALVGDDQLFISDVDDCTIRLLTLSTGMLTTVAGMAGNRGTFNGIGSQARFQRPGAMVAAGGDLYVLDNSSAIRRVNLSTFEVTTLAGSDMTGSNDGVGAQAQLDADSLTTDGTALYIADDGSHTIRRVTLPAGQVTTLAGNKGQSGHRDGVTAMFDQPLLIGFVKSMGALVVIERSGAVRKVPIGGPVAEVTTIGGAHDGAGHIDALGIKARFDSPSGIAADASAAYVLDAGNDVVRKLDLVSGAVTTVAGTPGMEGSQDGPGVLAQFRLWSGSGNLSSLAVLDGAGALLIADTGNCTIRRLELATRMVTTLAGASGQCNTMDGNGGGAGFNRPVGVAYHASAGVLFVADAESCSIRRVDVASRAVTTLVGSMGSMCTSSPRRDGAFGVATIGPIAGLAFDGVDKIYFADRGGMPIVRRIDLTQARIDTIAGSRSGSFDGDAREAEFRRPGALVLDGKGGLLLADEDNSTVRKLDLERQVVTTLVGAPRQRGVFVGAPPRVNDPLGLAVLPDGRILMTTENAILALR